MVDVNLTGSQFVQVCDQYFKDQIQHCFQEQAIYKSCVSSGKLEIIMAFFVGLLLLFLIIEIHRTYLMKKAQPPKQTGG